MKIKSILLLVISMFFFNPLIFPQNTDTILAEITSAIKNASAEKLATYFNSTIDLEAGISDGNFSKKQAVMIMKDFFKTAPIKSFSSNHKGSSNDGSKYMIGTYTSTNGDTYRVYILMKVIDKNLLINQLQFEKE